MLLLLRRPRSLISAPSAVCGAGPWQPQLAADRVAVTLVLRAQTSFAMDNIEHEARAPCRQLTRPRLLDFPLCLTLTPPMYMPSLYSTLGSPECQSSCL